MIIKPGDKIVRTVDELESKDSDKLKKPLAQHSFFFRYKKKKKKTWVKTEI